MAKDNGSTPCRRLGDLALQNAAFGCYMRATVGAYDERSTPPLSISVLECPQGYCPRT
jgi:hypothetical protein